MSEARTHQTLLSLDAFLLANLARARLAAGDLGAAGNAADEAVDLPTARHPVFEVPALVTRARVRAHGYATSGEMHLDLQRALDLVAKTGALPMSRSSGRSWAGSTPTRRWRAALQLYDKMGAPAQAERLQAELDRR